MNRICAAAAPRSSTDARLTRNAATSDATGTPSSVEVEIGKTNARVWMLDRIDPAISIPAIDSFSAIVPASVSA